MSDMLKRLTERRAQVWEAMKALSDRATEEGRDLSGEEQEQWERAEAELQAIDRRRRNIADAEQRAKDTEEAFRALEGKPQERQNPAEDRSGELRAWLQGKHTRTFVVQPPQGVSFRDLLTSTSDTPKAGYTIPQGFYGRLVEHLVETGTVLNLATVLNTSSGETLPIPKTTDHGGAAAVSEATGLAEDDPAFGVVNLGAYKYGQLIQVSRELVDDTGVDLEGYLARAAGRNLGLAIAPHLVTGDGASKPWGAVTRASVGKIGPAGVLTNFGAQDTAGQGFDLLIDLFYSVTAPYRASRSTAWLMADATAAIVRKLKASDGTYAWQPAVTVGQPDTILGKPVYTDPNVATPAASAKSVVFGDWSSYFVRMAGPIRFERSDDFAFDSDMVTFRAIMRADADLVDTTGALKVFQHAAA